MGVLVFIIAIVPLSGGSNINLMRAESPGPSVGKLVPKVAYSKNFIYYISWTFPYRVYRTYSSKDACV